MYLTLLAQATNDPGATAATGLFAGIAGIWCVLGAIWLVGLIITIVAIVQIVQSNLDPMMKLLWVLVVIFGNILGVILWFILGKKSGNLR